MEELLRNSGFKILESFYSEVNDLHFVEAKPCDYLRINGYHDLNEIMLKKPSKTNLLRTIAFPFVKAMPMLRMTIVVVAEKIKHPKPLSIDRWGMKNIRRTANSSIILRQQIRAFLDEQVNCKAS